MRALLSACAIIVACAMREAWHFRAIRARNVEDCARECDEDVKCRAWQYHRITRECRLNEYVEAAKNEHVAIDQDITYVSGVKRGAKRLRHAANAIALDERERTIPAFGKPTFGTSDRRRALLGHHMGQTAPADGPDEPPKHEYTESRSPEIIERKREMWRRRHAAERGEVESGESLDEWQARKRAERAAAPDGSGSGGDVNGWRKANGIESVALPAAQRHEAPTSESAGSPRVLPFDPDHNVEIIERKKELWRKRHAAEKEANAKFYADVNRQAEELSTTQSHEVPTSVSAGSSGGGEGAQGPRASFFDPDHNVEIIERKKEMWRIRHAAEKEENAKFYADVNRQAGETLAERQERKRLERGDRAPETPDEKEARKRAARAAKEAMKEGGEYSDEDRDRDERRRAEKAAVDAAPRRSPFAGGGDLTPGVGERRRARARMVADADATARAASTRFADVTDVALAAEGGHGHAAADGGSSAGVGGGVFAWERGRWAGQVPSVCGLATELSMASTAAAAPGPGESSTSANGVDRTDGEASGPATVPPLGALVDGCPLRQCLNFGEITYPRAPDKNKGDFVLDAAAIDDVAALFENTTRIAGAKSPCFRIRGAREVRVAGTTKAAPVIEDDTLLCNRKHGGVSCCHGEWRVSGSRKTPNGQVMCTSCLPFFIALGPEKTGTTDLYNRISLLSSVVPAARKETGWWTENMLSSPHHVSMAGYGIKYFKELDEAIGEQVVDPSACDLGEDVAAARSSGARFDDSSRPVKRPARYVKAREKAKAGGLIGRRLAPTAGAGGVDGGARRRLLEEEEERMPDESDAPPAPALADGRPAACELITGEATPSMLYWHHHGQQLLPRFVRCVHPTAKLIVTLRDPIVRTYSDYHFFGRLQASKGTLGLRSKPGGLTGDAARVEYIRRLTPENFDEAMRTEVKQLERCFAHDAASGQLLWAPPRESALEWDCEDIKKDQLQLLGFQSKRPPGRLLMSLYGGFIGRWLEYFPCDQLLVVRSDGAWTEPVLREVASFLGVDPDSARKAAAAEAVRPEAFAYNKEAFALARAAAKVDLTAAAASAATVTRSQPSKGLSEGDKAYANAQLVSGNGKPRPMLNGTRHLLAEFFEAHWDARFPDWHTNKDPCRR